MANLTNNPFNSVHAPLLWNTLLGEFGQQISYWPQRDQALAITIPAIWKEGSEDEEVSPGRYSNIWVQNSSLTALPRKGDAVENDGAIYDIVRVDATKYGFSRLVLQESSNG